MRMLWPKNESWFRGEGGAAAAYRACGAGSNPAIDLPEDATVEQAEDALARERSRLAAHRSALRNVERLAEERAAARSELSRRLGALDQEIEILNDGLQAQRSGEALSEMPTATRTAALARRQAAMSEMGMLRASVALLEDRGVLIPLQIDQAQRRVTHSEQVVVLLESRTFDLRHRAADAALQATRQQCRHAAELYPPLVDLATATEVLAELLWGEQGIVNRSEGTTRTLLDTQKNLADLDRIGEVMRRKYEAFGNRGSISRWWPQLPEGFPEPGDIASDLRRLDTEIPEVEYQLIAFEEQRSSNRNVGRQIIEKLHSVEGEEPDGELIGEIRELFATRRELLDELIQHYDRYSDQLTKQRTASSQFLTRIETLQRFLFAQILWARSVPRPIVPRLGDMVSATRWLTTAEHRQQAANAGYLGVREIRRHIVIIAITLVLVVLFRRRIRSRMRRLAKRKADPDDDSFGLTLEALLHTVLLAAPLPLIFYLGAGLLLRTGDSIFLASASFSMSFLASFLGLAEIVRQLFSPHGLAEAHFNWPARIAWPVHQRLIWPEIVVTPFLFVALLLAGAGIRLNSPEYLQVYNNSLGRVFFIIAMTVLGVSLATLFRLKRRESTVQPTIGSALTSPLRHFDIPVAHLIGFPFVMLATLVPALLAAAGFYITALLLAYQMLRTLWLLVGMTHSQWSALPLAGCTQESRARRRRQRRC